MVGEIAQQRTVNEAVSRVDSLFANILNIPTELAFSSLCLKKIRLAQSVQNHMGLCFIL